MYYFSFYSPAELQYYTSLYSLVIQIPCLIFLIDWGSVLSIFNGEDDESAQLSTLVHMAFLYLINGIFFHFQTITAYVLMDFISPVTHRYIWYDIIVLYRKFFRWKRMPDFKIVLFFWLFSVANTGKRALLIWLSVLLFGNPVTFLSGLGTLVVIIGVLVYNKATEIDNRLKKKGLPINCWIKCDKTVDLLYALDFYNILFPKTCVCLCCAKNKLISTYISIYNVVLIIRYNK